jgi:hypothetical protein
MATYTGVVRLPRSGFYHRGDHLTITAWKNGPRGAGGPEVKIVNHANAHVSWIMAPYADIPILTITNP